ncbi:2-isopropylmalate synthase [Wickerhamomyces ciferrii]|uniref:2-isopropylmalate synthase n=1 Tax=Wickerhamomyces ciferrii (strain ATCC 14091 / BCRC 22168 / CBS 111 / JCM 3599 / NBRC 0793 / NRRL Y-1031 F-60-10) TaxID=1206466 RepID=K0KDS4_WICCF|nr:2-isopropylmalate synthase [Wickerhamomyces ciferrii]CCH41076.1 2-isopropylmalate synthase [Wickerhamomyces ciferrii]
MFRRSLTMFKNAQKTAPYANMLKDPSTKYKSFPPVNLPNRQWPNKTITKAPRWLTTDLRDGNQSLPDPMNVEQKKEYFHKLVELGFKEIEVSFPSASQPDFDFTRYAVENAPDDVSIQVLVQSREHLIRRTVESVTGAKKATIHVYLATSDLFRDVVFNMSKEEAIEKAVWATKLVRSLTKDDPNQQATEWSYQFSPETFSDTTPEFAVEICEAVKSVWEPTVENPIIFNLPATVEVATPNVYADQIEYFATHISEREKVSISTHCHNDRGCGVAASELGMLAGADRVEGCLFGNGERTGNVDLVTVALNLYTQGVSPELDFSDLQSVIEIVEKCNKIKVADRAPYGGDLVVCAFSGSHQDAIKKGFEAQTKRQAKGDNYWRIPYLPLDPKDIGRDYEAVIRVNSQSGKGGAAWVVLRSLGLDLPRALQISFSTQVQKLSEAQGRELKSDEIISLFKSQYNFHNEGSIKLLDYDIVRDPENKDNRLFIGEISVNGSTVGIKGVGNGPISSFVDAISEYVNVRFEVVNYSEHSLGSGSNTQAATFIQLGYLDENNSKTNKWGVGVNEDVSTAAFTSVLSTINSLITKGEIELNSK